MVSIPFARTHANRDDRRDDRYSTRKIMPQHKYKYSISLPFSSPSPRFSSVRLTCEKDRVVLSVGRSVEIERRGISGIAAY